MDIKNRAYALLVNRHPGIRERYQKKREEKGRVRAWLCLLRLNFSYYVLRKKELGHMIDYPVYESARLCHDGPEGALSKKAAPDEFSRQLEKYDIISFDVFDTLILRPFSKPTDLFYVLGERLKYPDFKNIRIKSEQKARKIKYQKEGHFEVTLEDIYEVLLTDTGLKAEDACLLCPEAQNMPGPGERGQDISQAAGLFAGAEAAVEAEFCFANPYMLPVIKSLLSAGKRLVITSDMYLGSDQIKNILKAAGYPEFDACYVSSEALKSKSAGDLYDFVREAETLAAQGGEDNGDTKSSAAQGGGNNRRAEDTAAQGDGNSKEAESRAARECGNNKEKLSFAHVGDNRVSDIEHARAHGFEPFYVKNVNAAGADFRPRDMSAITGSLYRGTVNAHIHCGLNVYSREYEYGYVYGGLFVTGYCGFIHDFVISHNIDRVLFLSRDGFVLKKVYDELYPEDKNTEYVYWSRLAAAKMTAGRYKYDFMRRFIDHKAGQGITIKSVLESMELEDLLADASAPFLPDEKLTEKNSPAVKEYLNYHWDEVLSHYDGQAQSAGIYYAEVLSGAESAAAVDIGWAGSGAITLDYMVNDVWHLDCPITGIIAGTNTCTNSEPDFSETFLQSGKLVSYLFSQRENRDIWKFHDAGKNHNLFMEMLLDAPHGSLKGFYPDGRGGYELRFKEAVNDSGRVLEIHRGIMDFARQWKSISKKAPGLCGISGRDAYAPILLAENEKGGRFLKDIAGMMDEAGI